MSSAKQAFLNRVKKSTPEPTSLDSTIFKLVKNRSYSEALDLILTNTPKEKRVKFVLEKFQKSKFKAYSMGMKRFCETINSYLAYGNKTILLNFDKQVREEAKNNGYSMENSTFNAIRKSIIMDAIDNQPQISALALMQMYDFNNNLYSQDKIYMTIISDLINLNWPDNKGLKVLYGNSK